MSFVIISYELEITPAKLGINQQLQPWLQAHLVDRIQGTIPVDPTEFSALAAPRTTLHPTNDFRGVADTSRWRCFLMFEAVFDVHSIYHIPVCLYDDILPIVDMTLHADGMAKINRQHKTHHKNRGSKPSTWQVDVYHSFCRIISIYGLVDRTPRRNLHCCW